MARQRELGDGNGPLYAALWFGGLVGTGSLLVATLTLGPASIPIWGIACAALAVVARGPLGRALGRRIAGEETNPLPPDLPGELLGELDELRTRVMELEERVDFSERLLAQGRQVGTGGGDA